MMVQQILDFVGAGEGSSRVNCLSPSTWKEYKSVLKRWVMFAQEMDVDFFRPTVQTLEKCIRFYYQKGVRASALETMATAVSTIFSWKTGDRLGKKEPIISLIRGIQRTIKKVKKEKRFFEPELIFKSIEEKEWENERLERRLMKLATLLILTCAVRFSEMWGILKSETAVEDSGKTVAFTMTRKNNQSEREVVRIHETEERKGVCVVKAVQDVLAGNDVPSDKLFAYMDRRGRLKELSAGQISKLVRDMMSLAGIDKSFTPYQCKHSALSKAWRDGAQESEIADAARWAPGSKMFRAHYKVLSASDDVSRIIVGVGRKKRQIASE
jgi:site-specific recombinase XerD